MATAQPSHRASLLSGLRTGGVRSVSVPHTAGPSGSFNLPRMTSSTWSGDGTGQPREDIFYPSEFAANRHVHDVANLAETTGVTFNTDVHGRRHSLQPGDHASVPQDPYTNPLSAGIVSTDPGQFQMRMMQLELMKIQALANMQQLAQAQAHISHPQYLHNGLPEPASASAWNQSSSHPFMNPVMQGRVHQGINHVTHDSVPMTAALGGRFGSRSHQEFLHSSLTTSPKQPGRNMSSSQYGMPPSKSDVATSWRRSDSPEASVSGSNAVKTRPRPLRFTPSLTTVNAHVMACSDESETGDDSSSSKSDEQAYSSSPTTPLSHDSSVEGTSAREEASKKLFQGLGMGRPSIQVTSVTDAPPLPTVRSVSQVTRQPRGPPSASEELCERNFANRIRKKAIGGLGVLMEAREKRDLTADA